MDKLNRPLIVATALTVLIVGVVTMLRLAVDAAPVPAPAQLTSIDTGRPSAPVPATALPAAAPTTVTGHVAPVPPRAPSTFIEARHPSAPARAARQAPAPSVAAEQPPVAALPTASTRATGQDAARPAGPAEDKPTAKPATTTDPDDKPARQEPDTDWATTWGWAEPEQGQRPDDTHDQLSSRGRPEDQMRKQMLDVCERYGMPGHYCQQAASPRPGY